MDDSRRLLLKTFLYSLLANKTSILGSARASEPQVEAKDWICPEDFGAKGNGRDDDSASVKECIEFGIQENKNIRFLKASKYLLDEKITVTGRVNINATGATIISDSDFLEVIDGAGSKWKGGILRTKTTPFTITYSEDWAIKQKGRLGNGRMPFDNEATNIEQTFLDQKIGCALVFRSSNGEVLDSLKIENVTTYYGNIIIAGFDNVRIDACKIKGGAHMGGCAILNGTRDPLLWGYKNKINKYEFARGKGHRITNSIFYECRNNGLFISGSDDVQIDNCKFIGNGESGFKTAQYVKRSWTNTNCCCKNMKISNCYASGQGYDGFDLQNVFGSGEFIHIPSNILVFNCISENNRRTGFISQGGGNFFINCTASNNGSHGLVSKFSRNVKMLRCNVTNNLQVFDGIEIGLLGPDCIMEECVAKHTQGKGKYYLITHDVVDDSIHRKAGYSIKNIVDDFEKCNIDNRVVIIS
ncbi:right-handed parallel beta-helix repeat-containing protein [Klebsiella michiganensis]|nr:right-handed parallel beta-helix repeat-containing protein [Klebsiella michiganensis]MBG2669175.1 right-handed parallel beta-helix repeat-containing protein [Klebsiella michiganensis]MBG2674460.1 right-handed parallel beta-helix repeat-containing protein [Klebsiella michiganensis]MBG2679981.1 right-handed parallel beta-helix repeat-containing protein [Klebsiella michiganensis]MDU2715487.1 right-handed parallel beta-helix repeat-containing protein [Klebsiella michiganensis]MDW3069858.1 right